jgi:SSS family solute:Na+ symporter
LNPAADDRRVLAVTRGAAVGCGAVAVALAIVSPTIIGVIGVFYGLLGVSLFVPILAGLYVGRAGTPEALASIVCGVSTMVAVHFTTGGAGVFGLTPALAGLCAASAGFLVVFISRLRSYEPQRAV